MPVDPVITPTVVIAIGAALNAVSNLINGHYARKQNEEDRKERQVRYEQDRRDTQLRFSEDLDLRKARFIWEQNEAELAYARRLQDRMHQNQRDKEDRSFKSLTRVFNGSPDSCYVHDPYAKDYPNLTSLRLYVQISNGSRPVRQNIESHMNRYISQYTLEGTPIHHPTGVWNPNAETGSWVSSELHAWNSNIPTLILRVEPASETEFSIHGDLFGFPMGKNSFMQNIFFGKVSAQTQDIGETLSLIAVGIADMYYLSNFGKTPQLPSVLSKYLASTGENKEVSETVKNIIGNYQITLNALILDRPDIAIPTAIRMCEALAELPSKEFALNQIRHIEDITASILPHTPQLVERLQSIYERLNMPAEVDRLAKIKGEIKEISQSERVQLIRSIT